MVNKAELRDILEFLGLVGLGILSVAGILGAFPLFPGIVYQFAVVMGSVLFIYFAFGYFDIAADVCSLPMRLFVYLLVWLYSVGLAALFGFFVYGFAKIARGCYCGSP